MVFVFTDLDGTFLDHHNYSFDAAMPAYDRLMKNGASVFAVTSKTLAEIEDLALPFSNARFAIAENGMVVRDGDEVIPLGHSYQDILKFLNDDVPDSIREQVFGFSDMSVRNVVEATGLSEESAALAKSRDGSEPFLWRGGMEEMDALSALAQARGLTITQGGRFYHLMSKGGKDRAIEWVRDRMSIGGDIITVALGDGLNDAGMLACVDYGVKIPNDSGAEVEVIDPKGEIISARYSGPKGWNDSIQALLDDLGFGR